MNTNYNFILNLFQLFAQQNQFVQNTYLSFDDQRSLWYERIKEFPGVYGVIRQVNLDEQIVRWNIDVYFLDLLFDNRANEVDVMNNTLEIANQFQNFIHKNKDNNYTINQFSSLTPLNNFDNNRMNGWRVNMTLESKREQCFDATQALPIQLVNKLLMVIPFNEQDTSAAITIVANSSGIIEDVDDGGLTNLIILLNTVPVTAPFTLDVGDSVLFSFDAATTTGQIQLKGKF
jgi:hypothetical protein